MNFLLPLLVGGPDMANKGSHIFSYDAVINQATYWACVSRRLYFLVMKNYFDFFIKKSSSNFTDKSRLNVYFSSCVSTGFKNNRNNLGSYIAGLQKRSLKTKVNISTFTDLEIWGKNLRSNVDKGRFSQIEANMLELAPYQLGVIVGLILSDGWLNYPTENSTNARLGFEQGNEKLEYFWFVFTLLSHYCSNLPKFKSKSYGGKTNYSLYMQTRALPCFSKLHTLFYTNNVKIILSNIYELLTPVALAHWIAGDGQVASNGLRLCTDSYKITDIVKLMNVLMIKYRIKCNLHTIGGKLRIYISAKSISLLSYIVKPHMTKNMYYKLESGKYKTEIEENVNTSFLKKNLISKISKVNLTQKITFSAAQKNKKFEYSGAFSSYLAGLYEGDGHIWIQKQKGTKNHNPRFCITFGLKNEPLCKKLLDFIGSGFIRYKHSENACVLVVSPVVGLKKIVNLINGELRTPKIHQLHSLIDWLNLNHNTQLEKLPLNKKSLDNNSWLSGFVDADGSFSVQYTKTEDGAKKSKISCRMRIEQRVLDPITNNSYSEILNQICTFLNCNLLTRTQKSTDNTYYTLAATSKVSSAILIQYFSKYPLFSSKFLDYKDWEQVAYLIINNQHLTEEGINTVELVRSRMNTKRTEFNWEHLQNFY